MPFDAAGGIPSDCDDCRRKGRRGFRANLSAKLVCVAVHRGNLLLRVHEHSHHGGGAALPGNPAADVLQPLLPGENPCLRYPLQRCDGSLLHPDSHRGRGGLFRLPDAGQCACLYRRVAADHGVHVLHRAHGGQPVPHHEIHECGHQPALFPHAAVLRGHHSIRGVSIRAESRCRMDAPGRGHQTVEIRVHGVL